MSEMLRRLYLNVYNRFARAPTDEEINTAARNLDAGASGGPSGMCVIIFPGGRPDYCRNDTTDAVCQRLASENGGIARPIVPGGRCPQ